LGNTATDAGTVDPAVSRDGRYLYVRTGAAGLIDEYRVNRDGSLSEVGSVTVPDAVGGEGIAAS
jgi:6-phosphogluconolactonase (cycloisomerase 2 family)